MQRSWAGSNTSSRGFMIEFNRITKGTHAQPLIRPMALTRDEPSIGLRLDRPGHSQPAAPASANTKRHETTVYCPKDLRIFIIRSPFDISRAHLDDEHWGLARGPFEHSESV